MRRFVYSPKVYAYVETATTKNRSSDLVSKIGDNPLINLSDYIVSGEVSRKVNDISTASITLRNPDKMWTPLGNPVFHPMDKITIFLERIPQHPVQVFTGYIDVSPYYQMYPGTCTITASCTLKRLLHTYVDMALPFMMEFMQQYGWLPDLQSGVLRTPSSFQQNANGGLSSTPTGTGAANVAAKSTPAGTRVTQGLVGVVGDSLTEGVEIQGDLEGKLGSKWSVHYDAVVGRGTPSGIDAMRAMKKRQPPDVWVIGLGTNDDFTNASAFRKNIKAAMSIASGTPVYWLNLKGNVNGNTPDKLNKVLNAMKGQYANLQIIDWNSQTVSMTGVHTDAAGYQKRSQLIADAVRGGLATTGAVSVVPEVTADQFLQTDGSIGKMLEAVMEKIGGWNHNNIYIEAMPKGVPRRILTIFDQLQVNEEDTRTALNKMFSEIIGTSSYGGSSTAGGTVTGSFKAGTDFQIKGSNATDKQKQEIATAMAVADQLHAPEAARLGMLCAGIGESSFTAVPNGSGSNYWGVFQGSKDVWAIDDTEGMARCFLKGGKGFQGGGAIALVKGGTTDPGTIATTVEASGAAPSFYGQHLPEAKIIAKLWENNGTSTASSSKNTGPSNSQTNADAPHNAAAVAAQAGGTPTTIDSNSVKAAYAPPLQGDAATKNLARTDQGVDFNPPGTIHAIGNGKVTFLSNETGSGGAGGNGPFLIYQLADGPLKGAYIFAAELWNPCVNQGDTLTKGQKIGTITGHIEIGYAGGPTGNWNVLTPYGGSADGTAMPAGKMFARLCRALGVHTAQNPGPGPMGPGNTAPQWDGTTASGGGGTSSATDNIFATAKASAFAAIFNFPTIEQVSEAMLLTGQKSLMNDTTLMPFIQELCQGSLRNFQSMPNGDFFAFFPDYFGGFGHRKVYWEIDDVEILQGKIDLSDEALATHVYVSGDTLDYDGSVSFQEKLMSTGVVTIANAGVGDFINLDKESKGFFTDSAEALAFLNRYGARVVVEDAPYIRNHFFEVFLAFQTFMLLWARQFNTTFTFTFMPEIFPGGLVSFPTHGIQMYVDEVHHSFDYVEGFTTQANLSAPAALRNDKGEVTNSKVATGMVVSDILSTSAPEKS